MWISQSSNTSSMSSPMTTSILAFKVKAPLMPSANSSLAPAASPMTPNAAPYVLSFVPFLSLLIYWISVHYRSISIFFLVSRVSVIVYAVGFC